MVERHHKGSFFLRHCTPGRPPATQARRAFLAAHRLLARAFGLTAFELVKCSWASVVSACFRVDSPRASLSLHIFSHRSAVHANRQPIGERVVVLGGPNRSLRWRWNCATHRQTCWGIGALTLHRRRDRNKPDCLSCRFAKNSGKRGNSRRLAGGCAKARQCATTAKQVAQRRGNAQELLNKLLKRRGYAQQLLNKLLKGAVATTRW